MISGNLGAGIKMLASSNNTVGYNLIGINAAGTAALPNAQDGVWLTSGSTNNTIGSSTFGEGQYIGGNGGAGVQITTSDSNNVRVSTRIGVGPTGALLGNGGGGVFLTNSANNFVAPTLVAHNSGAGVAAIGLTSVNNFLSPFNVFDNTGLPVDLGNNGATANDPGDSDPGPNNLLNYPVITAASGSVVTGTVCANCAVYIYAASGNPAAAGGGGSYLAATNAIGVNWSTTLPGGRTKFDVTLQAYDGMNTSEFSPRPILFLPITRR